MPGRPITGQLAEIPGPHKAQIFPSAEVVISLIKKASRPLFVIGSESINVVTIDGKLVDTSIRLLKNPKMTLVATGHLVAEFKKRKENRVFSMQLMNLSDRLRDPNWGGFDGKGPYDLIVFAGFPYYLEWLVLSGLKSFAINLRTISLDRTYQPNAAWSIGYMIEKEWKEVIEKIVKTLEESG
jgi:acetyl-CoA decarbonylase/synthase complex subunit epsilon